MFDSMSICGVWLFCHAEKVSRTWPPIPSMSAVNYGMNDVSFAQRANKFPAPYCPKHHTYLVPTNISWESSCHVRVRRLLT